MDTLFQPVVVAVLAVVVALLLLWTIILTITYLRQQRFFAQFTQGVAKRDLKTILANIASSLKTAGAEIEAVNRRVDAILKADHAHIQKIGFVRFNPFSDTGGDQSFCVCFLDQDDNGLVMTSLHSREQTRTYAKVVTKGKVEGTQFSKEEKEALKEAMKVSVPAKK